MLRLLKISSLERIGTGCPKLDDRQRLRFVAQEAGCIQITPEHFRLDLEDSRDSPFNQTAISVFARDLHEKIAKGHWYSLTTYFDPLAPELVTVEYLEYSLYHHLKHVKDVYKQLVLRPNPEKMRENRKGASRKQRKQTVRVIYHFFLEKLFS